MSSSYYEREAQRIVQDAKSQRGAGDEPGAEEKPLERKRERFTEVIQLPLWPEPQRAAPNVVVRSSLFAVVKKGNRQQLKNVLLKSWPGSEIRFTGEQLDQYDADVWYQALHLCRLQESTSGVTFTARAFLRGLGRSQSGQDVKRLDDSLTRMVATAVRVTVGRHSYVGSLIHEYAVDEATGRYRIVLNPRLAQLFDGGYTRFDWQLRQGLKTDLAKWLHAFVLSHRASEDAPQHVSICDLHVLAGSKVTDEKDSSRREAPTETAGLSKALLRKFRHNVKRAMSQLHELGIVSSWRLTENDALAYTRSRPRPHLAR